MVKNRIEMNEMRRHTERRKAQAESALLTPGAVAKVPLNPRVSSS